MGETKMGQDNVLTLGPPEPIESFVPDVPWIRDPCNYCGIVIAMDRDFFLSRLRGNESLYCPNGHHGRLDESYIKTVTHTMKHSVEGYRKNTCGKCGITYMAPEEFFKSREENCETFYCPNGCPRVFIKPEPPPPPPKTEADIDYEKMINYHQALSGIALLKPKFGKTKQSLKLAINMARNALELSKLKE